MYKFSLRASKKAGLPPGTLVHVGEKWDQPVQITLIDYDADQLQEKTVKSIEDVFHLKDEPTVTWINIDGLQQIDIMDKIGRHFEVHPLVMEDIVNTGQRPKMEDFDNYLFIVLKMLFYDEEQEEVVSEQISMVVGANYLISFQERQGDVFAGVRTRIRTAKGRIRKYGSDYLAYVLIDAIVDNYFSVLEVFGDKLEAMEEELIAGPSQELMESLHAMKREMVYLRKQVWPLRELLSGAERGESPLIVDATRLYLRDVYDHTVQIIDTIETYRDILSVMLDMYLSVMSNRMNEVMKVLTIMATIFIPLTFLAGIYGMNFKYMPELEWRWGYFSVWAVMIATALALIVYFKRKKWL